MKVKITLSLEYDVLDFYSQDDLDEMANQGVPMDFSEFKYFLTDYFYDDPDDLITALKFEEVKE